jgi:hypothetical protein
MSSQPLTKILSDLTRYRVGTAMLFIAAGGLISAIEDV